LHTISIKFFVEPPSQLINTIAMPALTVPPDLKRITQYVRRAEELDRDKTNPESRLVAYYCRQYAVHRGISMATTDEGKTCLGELLGILEADKHAMSAFTKEEAKFLCAKFANKIFDTADLEDRTGGATKDTARKFYAAGSFLDILQQFYQDDDESDEPAELKKRAIYAKWKSTEILKAIKEGRTPAPGGYGEEDLMTGGDEEDEKEEVKPDSKAGDATDNVTSPRDPSPRAPSVETVPDEEEDITLAAFPPPPADEPEKEEEGTEVELGPPPAYTDAAPIPPPPQNIPPLVHKPPLTFNSPPQQKPLVPPPSTKKDDCKNAAAEKPKKTSFFGFGGGSKKNGKASKAELADATELTRFALAALLDKDEDLAVERLQQALQVLGR
jgi:vacuolar protein sorting-associated protein VTA1